MGHNPRVRDNDAVLKMVRIPALILAILVAVGTFAWLVSMEPSPMKPVAIAVFVGYLAFVVVVVANHLRRQ